jgi:hypothetical protein
MLPLLFLTHEVQSRFQFKVATDTRPTTVTQTESAAAGQFHTSAEVWVIEYAEKRRGTVVRTPQGEDLPTSGRFWIDPETGRVLMSELLTRATGVAAAIDVSYQSEPLPGLVGLSVPAEMRERYDLNAAMVVTGRATYGRFRQFGVSTEEGLAAPSNDKK